MENGILEERRECLQKPIKRNGRVIATTIPNYLKVDSFMSINERNFYEKLVKVVEKMRKKEKKYSYLIISSQVAVNRLIRINNKRIRKLYDEIENKSVDFVIYDKNNNHIVCAIELDTEEHFNDIKRINRDDDLYHMFKGNINLVRIPAKDYNCPYTEEYICKFLKLYKVIDWEWES